MYIGPPFYKYHHSRKFVTAHWRFVHYHGQRFVRLNRNQSIYAQESTPRTFLIKFMSIILFAAPRLYLKRIESIYVDNVISLPSWCSFIDKMVEQWYDLTLWVSSLLSCRDLGTAHEFQGTVFVTANVSVMAMPLAVVFPNTPISPGVENATQSYPIPARSPVGIACLISTIASLGSILASIILTKFCREGKDRNSAPAAVC